MRKKICFVAQFPPPIHGLTKAVDTLYHSELAREFEFEKIDITDNKRFPQTLTAIRHSRADLFYFTIAQSVGGNLRDLVIFRAIGNRPCIVHLHGGYYRTLIEKDMPAWQRKMNYKAAGKLGGAITLGPSLRWIFQGLLPDEKIFTVPNCVDDEFLMSDAEFESKAAAMDQRPVKHILYLSNFIRSKGYPEVLEMARLEKEQGGERRFHFDFAGKFFQRQDEAFFRNYVRENGLEDSITYHGVVSGDEKRRLLKRCDIFVLLTDYPREGQPISILEAMGNGMVIVTTDHAGIPDLASDGVNGIVVRKDKMIIPDILDRLEHLPFEQTAVANRLKIMDRYTERTYIANMKKVFEKAIR